MNLIFYKIIVLFVLSVKVAYPSIVSGKITDAETNKPLVGANIIIQNLFKGASIGLDGDYEINSIPLGTHILTINHFNYCEITDTIKIFNNDQILNKNYSLVKKNRKVYLTELNSFKKYHRRIEKLYEENKNLFILSFNAVYEWDSSAVIVNPVLTNNSDESVYIPKYVDHYKVRINNKKFSHFKDMTVFRCPTHIFSRSYEPGNLIEVKPNTTEELKSFFMRNQDILESSNTKEITISLIFDFDLEGFVYTDDCSEEHNDIKNVYNKILRVPVISDEHQFKLSGKKN